MPATRFEDMVVRQKAHLFVLAACRWSRTSPRSETHGLWLEDVSKLLEAYSQAILNSNS
jgi:hypothetical protein